MLIMYEIDIDVENVTSRSRYTNTGKDEQVFVL